MASWPELTYESLRALNHLTGHGPIPAPTVYRILGELKGIGHLLPQACARLARGLEDSLQSLNVYDHRREPGESVTEAVLLLNQALLMSTGSVRLTVGGFCRLLVVPCRV